MTKRITDEDVALLANITASLQGDYPIIDDEWKNSPFAWITLQLTSRVP